MKIPLLIMIYIESKCVKFLNAESNVPKNDVNSIIKLQADQVSYK